MERLICLLLGYLFGLFQSAFFIGKCRHIDIRTKGSKNAGTTNALRVMGWRAGAATFAGDFLKAVLVILLVGRLFGKEHFHLWAVYAGLGATLGHNYPFYMGFKGGKGIAVMAGIIAAFGTAFIPIPLAGFIVPVLLTGYISLGSLLASLLFLTETILFVTTGAFGAPGGIAGVELCAVTGVICLLAWWRHRSNIARLRSGNENSLFGKRG